jgi:hypothetical protein
MVAGWDVNGLFLKSHLKASKEIDAKIFIILPPLAFIIQKIVELYKCFHLFCYAVMTA